MSKVQEIKAEQQKVRMDPRLSRDAKESKLAELDKQLEEAMKGGGDEPKLEEPKELPPEGRAPEGE